MIANYRRLEKAAYWNLLDPGLWLTLVQSVRHVVSGDRPATVPVPRIGGRRFLPILSADWLPDGGIISLETVFSGKPGHPAGPRWFSFTLRRGDGPGGSFGFAGAATEKVFQTRLFRVGGEAEVWRRADGRFGGGFRLISRILTGGLQDFFFYVGAKSDGHWPGRPVNTGPFAGFGYTTTF